MAIEQRVDRLEEALMRLVYIQQKTEMEIQSLKNEMKDFKDEMLAFKDEMKVFKDEMLAFKDEMKDFKDEMLAFKDEMKAFKDEMKDFKDEILDFKEWSKKNIENLNKQWGNLANRMGTLVEDIFFQSMRQTIKKYFNIDCKDILRDRYIDRDGDSIEIDILAISKETKHAFIVEVKSKPDREEYINRFLEKLNRVTRFLPELEGYNIIGIYAGLDMKKETIDMLTKNKLYAMVVKGDILEIVNFEKINSGV